MARKKGLTPVQFLERVLSEWKAFTKHHTGTAKAIRAVLDELYYLREKVSQYEE